MKRQARKLELKKMKISELNRTQKSQVIGGALSGAIGPKSGVKTTAEA